MDLKTLLDLAGAVGYILIFTGLWMLGNKNKYGWQLRMAGDLLWAFIGYEVGLYSIVVFGIIGAFIDYRGWVKWKLNQS